MLALLALPAAAQQTIQAASTRSIPLLLPTYVAFDAQGNLYFAETNHHVIRRIDITGALTTVVGDGTQGFSGDRGPAVAAQLDSPAGIALDAIGNLYIADAHNHRIRRVDAATGLIATVAGNGSAAFTGDNGAATQASLNQPTALAADASGNLFLADQNNHRIRKVVVATGTITTVAGNGQQGFTGDNGPATSAALDSPSGLTVDAAGNLYLADTRNHRVRIVRAATGTIATLAGTGRAAFSGDNAAAVNGALALPRGVSVDSAGNVTVADSNNHRIRRISSAGTMTTVAGNGTQAFAGDGGLAVSASLDTPRGVTLSPVGLVTLGDTGNQRVRQIAADATIDTLAGLGASVVSSSLVLTAPVTTVYGTGTLNASLAAATPATGSVTFYESAANGTNTLASVPLTAGAATLSTAAMSAGTHTLYASYAGDLLHPAAQSAAISLTISPAPLAATASSANIVYGQSVPALTGTLSGVLPQDAGKVSLQLATSAAALSPVGSYAIAGALSGPAAGNYALAPLSGAALTIAKASSIAAFSAASPAVTFGQPVNLAVHVASTTSGTPTGSVMLLDGSASLASLPLSPSGDASYSSSTLAAGTHTLTAVYGGDGNFLPSTTAPQTVGITNAIPADFTLAATGPTSQTVTAGSAAAFPFSVQMQGAALSSPITLAASTLPAGITASFSPTLLPPGGAVTSFTLTLQTSKAVAASLRQQAAFGFAVLVLPWLGFAARNRRGLAASLCAVLLVSTTGCGARVFAVASGASLGKSYPITVSGTATSPSGTVLLHTVTVTLNIQ